MPEAKHRDTSDDVWPSLPTLRRRRASEMEGEGSCKSRCRLRASKTYTNSTVTLRTMTFLQSARSSRQGTGPVRIACWGVRSRALADDAHARGWC